MTVTNLFKPNISSIIYSIRACTSTGLFCRGQQLHCHILKSGFGSDALVSADLINFYVKFNRVNDAHNLFVEIPEPTVVSWNSLISGYVNHGQFRKALKVFTQLENSNVFADSYSFTAALSACGQLSLVQVGRSVHSKIVKYGVGCSVFVANCLINMYGKCGFTTEATTVFQEMVEKDNISWNSVIAANARNGKVEQAFAFMHQMPEPDTISYNELIDGIARYGAMEEAITELSKMQDPDSSSWNSILTGYVNRQRGREALDFFCKMHLCGVCMDEFTFSSILSGIASLLLGQEGHLNKAEDMIKELGYSSCGMVWKALLNACVCCGNVEVAEVAAAKVIELESDFEFVYVMMSNIYASHGKWDDASGVRVMMKERMVTKEAGCSWIEIEDVIPTSSVM
ncbi:pentatricopeptide repeat-containing protein [Dorcoceras hygrometricum]|uniref:Pentatricopeptide repeat-containing protein n=1 Tax=Dorcoceras hygrometricum TaxID=472368 RepID=A0A2Z7CJ67_9LAMI|nr:pentatricopeptide repeat-containing protein [Dorcoceras hygrometricum]